MGRRRTSSEDLDAIIEALQSKLRESIPVRGLMTPRDESKLLAQDAERQRRADLAQTLFGSGTEQVTPENAKETIIYGYRMPQDMQSFASTGVYAPVKEAGGEMGMTIPAGQMLYTNIPRSDMGEPAFVRAYSNLTSRIPDEGRAKADLSTFEGVRNYITELVRSGEISPEKGAEMTINTLARQSAEEIRRQALEDRRLAAQEKAEEARRRELEFGLAKTTKDFENALSRIENLYKNTFTLQDAKKRVDRLNQLFKSYAPIFKQYGADITQHPAYQEFYNVILPEYQKAEAEEERQKIEDSKSLFGRIFGDSEYEKKIAEWQRKYGHLYNNQYGKEWIEGGKRYRINPKTGKKEIWVE